MSFNNNTNNKFSDYSFKNMPQPQKIAVISLSVVGVAIIFFGVLQFRARIVNPFKFNGISTSTPETMASLLDLDTDKDSLSDYDELNVYKTSPYLEDTDSDGFSDREETDNGTDPTCPAGQDCQGEQVFSVATTSSTINLTENISGVGEINIASGTSEAELKNALAGEVDVATLRKLLIEGGASQEMLDQISDSDLLKSYQEVLNKQNE